MSEQEFFFKKLGRKTGLKLIHLLPVDIEERAGHKRKRRYRATLDAPLSSISPICFGSSKKSAQAALRKEVVHQFLVLSAIIMDSKGLKPLPHQQRAYDQMAEYIRLAPQNPQPD